MRGGPIISISNVKEIVDSNFLVSGITDDLGMNLYMFLVGIDRDGNQFMEVKEDFRFHAGAGTVELDDSGNIYIAGYTGSDRDDGCFMPPQDTDVFLIKLDSEGREIWRTVFEYPLENRPFIMEITEQDEVLLVIRSFTYESRGLSDSYTHLVFWKSIG